MSSTPFFAVEGLMAGYGDVQVLWGVDISVEAGEIACIVGSNGAGKSTFMRTVSGLLPARGGRVHLRGQDLTGASPDTVLAAGIAQVPEGRRLFGAMSVRDNLLMGAYLRTDGAAAIARDLERVYELFPILRSRSHQDGGTLSGGEQQMCAIARGLMSAPALLLVDELSLGLAPRIVEQLGEVLAELNRRGLTILLVEQDVVTAFEMASRAFVIDSGRVTLHGPAATLAADPQVQEAYIGLA